MDPIEALLERQGVQTGVSGIIDQVRRMFASHEPIKPGVLDERILAHRGPRAPTPSELQAANQMRGSVFAEQWAAEDPRNANAMSALAGMEQTQAMGDPANWLGAGVMQKVGRAAREGVSVLDRMAKPTLRPEGEIVGGGGALPDMVPRSKRALQQAVGPGEEDIVRSMMTGSKEPSIPASVVEQARTARATLRSEAPTTPGAQASPEEWAKWGEQHGVNMTVSESKPLGIKDPTTGRDVVVPGGLEGEFTVPDLFQMKAFNFDPNSLPKDVHDKLMQKFIRTYEKRGDDPVAMFNDLNFSLMSPNAPLTQNEFLAARTRVRSMDDVKALAARVDEPNLSQALDVEAGVGAAARGGMGVKGTAELDNQAHLAKLLLEKPEMFRPMEGETLRDVGFRVMNQVPGLSVKTASLGIPWSNLSKANTSAVDLHMIRNFYPRLMKEDPEFAEAIAKRMKGGKVNEEEAAIAVIGGAHPGGKYRLKGGKLNPNIPEYLTPEKLAHEPEMFTVPNKYYQRVMEYVDESRGADPLIELFPEQWRLWDRFRQRVEPHELMHPDFRKLPKQSFSEMQAALQAHKDAGYTGAKPVMGESDWRKLYYGNIDPRLAIGMGAAAAGGAAAAPSLRDIYGSQ